MFSYLKQDLKAALNRDPAAKSWLQVILLYPGFQSIIMHRIAHALVGIGLFWMPHIIARVNRLLTGIEIHPAAEIGSGIFIDHGMGVVIGETAQLGNNVTIYHGVTLGGTGKGSGKRHPTVRDGSLIGARATILGPIVIGKNAKIGAGAVVLESVPESHTAVGVPAKTINLQSDEQSKNEEGTQ